MRHAVEHNVRTSHNFSVEVNSHRIWNYLGDNYVHRIIRTKLGNESNKKYEEMEAEVLGQALGKSGSKNKSMGGSKGESTSKRREDRSSFISVYEDEFDADVASPPAAHVDKIKQLAETYKVGREPYKKTDEDSEEEKYEEEFEVNNS